MSGSTLGTLFKISTWGESHGKGLGVVIDGCPAGVSLCEEDIQIELDRRKPGEKKFGTKRKEDDEIQIMSGVFQGKTTGTPISLMILNKDHRSHNYGNISEAYRPGHADFGYDEKYGFRDYRGGGRSSGRETAARVAAGAVAKKILIEIGVNIFAYTTSIGPVEINPDYFSFDEIRNNELSMPDKFAYEKAAQYVEKLRSEGDSAGGIVECVVSGMKAGVGEPVFSKLDAELSKAIVSIGAVKGIEFGEGFRVAEMTGSENNDPFYWDLAANKMKKKSNNAGGILGGMSDGSEIVFRASFKPTPSILKTQQTANKNHENIDITIEGRHDPIIISRAIVVVEAMTAITLVDLIFIDLLSKIDNLKLIYRK